MSLKQTIQLYAFKNAFIQVFSNEQYLTIGQLFYLAQLVWIQSVLSLKPVDLFRLKSSFYQTSNPYHWLFPSETKTILNYLFHFLWR